MKKAKIQNPLYLSRPVAFLIIFVLILSFSAFGLADNTPIKKANYKLAARFTPAKMEKMVFSTSVDTHWLKHSDRFWYSYETSEGKTFYIADPVRKTKRPIFDNVKMAAELTLITKDPYDAKHLPIETIKFVKQDRAIQFEVESSQEEKEDVAKKEEEKKKVEKKEEKIEKEIEKEKEKKEEEVPKKKEKPKKKIFYFEYDLATGKLTLLKDYEKPPKRPEWASISPDEQTILFGRHHNLYTMDKANYEKALKDEKDPDIVEHQLTTDGEEYYSYAQQDRGETNVDKEKNKDKRKGVRVVWSRDSKKFAMTRTDERKVKDLWVINSVAEPRPTLETYKYQMPGESESPVLEVLIFELESKKKTKVDIDRFKDQTVSILTAPRLAKNRDDENRPSLWLSETPDKLYFSRTSRDLQRIDICVADAVTGETKVLIEERLNTYVETRRLGLVNNGKELIHWSERNGWAHFYLFDGDGNLKNQITSGPWHCEDIEGIDEKNRVLYFTANGHEQGEDPYYYHLYKINFDGTGLKLLNKGNFNHSTSMCDSNLFFVDNYSRVDNFPESVLYDNQGNLLRKLETVDLSLLMQAGFKFPETFQVKADDGITDIYGIMYKPFDFDETMLYPIIAYVYPGPQTESVPKSFSVRSNNITLAQFGLIVICVGNRGGHPARSKWYHNYGYGNLRDYGLADKKAAIEQLADRYPYIDIDKVGIYGHSGGGFMSTAAMLVYPDFFKVAVSSSGNHENNVYNRWWSEKHHGVKEVVDKDGNIKFEYSIEKNSEIAKNLKGRLLLTTGDIDNNVHPANTLRLANALIRANKRFDFFVFPGQRHGFGDMNDYFFWIRADYFCKHLIGDYSQSVDMVELNREKEMTGDKSGRR
ncbi:MAG: S9 family peptidase [Candidatus Aminicenantes bacterium]|nr:S9 family peptidase [Candidatus Aminicenantes bacterium]